MKRRAEVQVAIPETRCCEDAEDDATLMTRVAASDVAAFEIIYHRYAHRVRMFLDRLIRRSLLVDEAFNDTMFVVWRRAHTYDATAKLATWIFAIAYRKGLQCVRRAKAAFDFGQAANDGVYVLEPDGVLQQLELQQQVNRALSALSMDQRTVLHLVYYQGCGCREIADIMQCPIDTVKTRAFYARRKLKDCLGGVRNDAP
jgi:RNA polymerase sigma factor (sigma-70 family)